MKGDSHMCTFKDNSYKYKSKSSSAERAEQREAEALLDGMLSGEEHTHVNIPDFPPAAPEYTHSHQGSSSSGLTIGIIILLSIIAIVFLIKKRNRQAATASPVLDSSSNKIVHKAADTKPDIINGAKIKHEHTEIKERKTQPKINIEDNYKRTDNITDSSIKKNNKTETVSPASNNIHLKEKTIKKTADLINEGKKTYERIATKASEIQKDINIDYNAEKAKEMIDSSIKAAKETTISIASRIKKFIIDHDIIGKLKTFCKILFVGIFYLCVYLAKALLYIIQVFIGIILNLFEAITKAIKK